MLVAARATSIRRSVVAIVRAEPVWAGSIGAGLLVGGALLLRDPGAHRGAPVVALAAGLAQLLSQGRSDARLIRLLGVAPRLVRVVEALLWTSPILAAAALVAPRTALAASVAVAVTASLGLGARREVSRRTVRWTLPSIPRIVPEWTAGVRRTVVPLGALIGVGIIGSGSPGVVVAATVAVALVTCVFFWGPAEGWLLLNGSGWSAGRVLRRKILASAGLLCALLAPVILTAAIRRPELITLYCLVLVGCVHAHAAAIAAKYAGYTEGQPLHAAGTLVWLFTTASLLVPPIGLALLAWLYRRAVGRITPFCAEYDAGR